ncbi:ABC transporter substrate-binding protein [Anaerosalibacter sp. Marseille-P3206]|uniref:ABC transporter substrate-binding protein n=1 Tax=Anaerosalibacter sp. Marseille-P3206 TaxID=1871005 RepID=UPI000BEAC4E3|nr:ABC transporter substrate-binding protein [Anaerosalibacter sp. Marseille-P3206]
MKKIVALLLVLVLSFSVFTGCGNKNVSEQGNVEKTEETQKVEDVLYTVINSGTTMDTQFDHLWVNRGELFKVLTFRSLFLPDATLTNVKPDLASDYKISEDGLTYTITMKDGVTWHDGEPVTAEDVVWSIGTSLKASLLNAIYSGAFSKIEGAEEWKAGTADSLSGLTYEGNTITMKLTNPVGNMLNVLGQFAIYPKHLLKDEDPLEIHNAKFWQKPIGNGMYKIDEFKPGNYLSLVPYENYDGEKPKISKVVLNIISDPVAAAQAGQLDIYNTNAANEISELKNIDGLTAEPVDILFYRYFVMNLKDENGKPNEKLDDVRIRKALLYAIDRKTLEEKMFTGLAQIHNTGVPSSYDEYYKSAEDYEYNPEKAKQLLEDAGFDFSKTLKLRYYYDDQASIDFMEAIAQYWTEVGIKVDVQKFQGDATSEIFTTRDHDIVLKGLSAFGYEEWYGEYASDNTNFVRILGKEGVFDDKINELRETTDSEKRAEILQDLQKLEQEYLYKLPLLGLQNIYFIRTDKVKTVGEFGNPWYNYDRHFEEWEIIK